LEETGINLRSLTKLILKIDETGILPRGFRQIKLRLLKYLSKVYMFHCYTPTCRKQALHRSAD